MFLLCLLFFVGVGEGWGQAIVRATSGVSGKDKTQDNIKILKSNLNAQIGDLLILNITGLKPIANAPNGWIEIGNQSNSSSTSYLRTWYKIAGQAETGTTGTIDFSSGSENDKWSASIIRIDLNGAKLNTTTPFSSGSTTAQSSPASAPNVAISENHNTLMTLRIFTNVQPRSWIPETTVPTNGTSTDNYGLVFTNLPNDCDCSQAIFGGNSSSSGTGTFAASMESQDKWVARTIVINTVNPTPVFRSKASSDWSSLSTWEQQYRNSTWENVALQNPTNAIPYYESSSRYASNTVAPTHSIPVPSGGSQGDLLLMIVRPAGTRTISTAPSGWTLLTSWGSNGTSYIYYKEAGTTESPTVNVGISASDFLAASTFRIRNWDESSLPVVATIGNSNDPPTVSPSWGNSSPSLFLTVLTNLSAGNATAAPTNFLGLATSGRGNQTSTNPRVASAFQVSTAASSNPGTFSQPTATNPHAATIAIKARPGNATIRDKNAVTISRGELANSVTVESGGVLDITANPGTLALVNSKTGISVLDGGRLNLKSTAIVAGSGNFILASGATLEVGSPEGIAFSGASGNVQNTGSRTFDITANYVYNGTVAQVTGSGLTGSNNLTINNAKGLTLSRAVLVTGTLSLTSGIITTAGNNILTVGSSGSITGGSSTSYINGELARIINSTTETFFPVGTDPEDPKLTYFPLYFSYPSSPGASVEVKINRVGTTSDHPLINVPDINPRFGKGYWKIIQSSTGRSYSVGLSPGEEKVAAGDEVIVLRREGNGNPQNTGKALRKDLNTVSAGSSRVTNVVEFFFNEAPLPTSHSTNEVMLAENARIQPVEFLSFEATYQRDRRVGVLDWKTAKEWDSSHFILERSVNDVKNWEEVGEVGAAGYSSEVLSYSFTDQQIPASGGTIFYRIKQVDFDGTYIYSVTKAIQVNPVDGKGYWVAYPNPIEQGAMLNLEMLNTSGYQDQSIFVQVSNLTGSTFQTSVLKNPRQVHEFVNEFLQQVSKGMYVLSLSWGENSEVIKLLVR
ncbi:hypothetical protein ACFPIK_15465 [Algoriphagus aquatilis]|uniref:T9SS type A sorting domain-containing protein n=1 Tax=Algoriphagus aquatilis TaxID=490186 RepID=A0ABW0C1R1_9BACT